jgi:hypothetical protein
MFSASLVVLFCLVAWTSADVPATGGIFCADVKETLSVNGTIQSQNGYQLCMNTAILEWKRTNEDGSFQLLNVVNTLYTINARGECTYSKQPIPADASQLPFSMVKIDEGAHEDGTGDSPGSGIPSTIYYHDRKSHVSEGVTYPEEMMYWYVTPGTQRVEPGPIPDILIESVCKQVYDVFPGDGGTSTVQYGNRDFSTNYDVYQPMQSATFLIPPEISSSCQEVEYSASNSKDGGAFGPVLF